ncbi:MAG: c-type cytochrome [Pseudomonadales bacterium]|nr:c-type cytochrome [Pseudomonadales bacterium]
MKNLVYLLALSLLYSCGGPSSPEQPPPFSDAQSLGKALFSDVNLSADRSQSCATCHNPDRAFIDTRLGADGNISAVSLGDDGISLGDRNTPTAAYARFSPAFTNESHARFNSQQGAYSGHVGGQFIDGRAEDLADQAAGPPLNPIEMAMPDKQAVVQRILENGAYTSAFKLLFGEAVFGDSDQAYAKMAESIALFEQTDEFSSFDSKYDKSLRGEYVYSPLSKAALGKALFFSQQFTNCATCHQLHANGHQQEMFTSYEYHNIGVPKNSNVRAVNGKGEDFIDPGLLGNELVFNESEKGKFKVPTLRNVAVTQPYMHNGVFGNLKTVIEFYDHYLAASEHTQNPETAFAWQAPEVIENLALLELEDGRTLDNREVEALVCFLWTLTDERYEHFLEEIEAAKAEQDRVDCDL